MKVSVITTCFNARNVIEKTIKSVLSQNYSDFEYIIQDGSSTDDTEKICMSYMQAFRDKNIPFHFYSEKDSGIYDGMNKGVEKAVGKYINFMNADDVFYDENVIANVIITNVINCESSANAENMLSSGVSSVFSASSQNQSFTDSDPDIIYGDAVEFECGNYYKYNKDISRIKKAMPFSHQSVFAKRQVLLKHPFDTSLSIGADYDFLLTAYMNGYTFSDCGKFVCIVSRDGKSSRDLYNTFIETVAIQKRHGIENYTEKEYAKKLRATKLKQIVMDNIPEALIQKIRLMQRKHRGQDEVVRL